MEEPVPAGAEPRADRRLAAHQQDPHVVVQRGHEHLAQPRVHEAEHLEVVKREDDRAAGRAEPGDDRVDVVLLAIRRGKCLEEASLRRLDRPAVERDGRGAGELQASEEAGDERRLADSGVAVDVHDGRCPGRADEVLEHR